jgi:hypothetical protein
MNVVALTPLVERFELEYGTLTTLTLFFGREYILCAPYQEHEALIHPALTSVPAVLYLIVERLILRRDNGIMGAR